MNWYDNAAVLTKLGFPILKTYVELLKNTDSFRLLVAKLSKRYQLTYIRSIITLAAMSKPVQLKQRRGSLPLPYLKPFITVSYPSYFFLWHSHNLTFSITGPEEDKN